MPIMVGGNDSVIWKVRANRANYAFCDPEPKGAQPYFQEGVNDTDPDDMFKVTIKLPEGAPLPRLQNFPSAEVTQRNGRVFVTIWLPIEPSNGKKGKDAADPDQISIDWTRK